MAEVVTLATGTVSADGMRRIAEAFRIGLAGGPPPEIEETFLLEAAAGRVAIMTVWHRQSSLDALLTSGEEPFARRLIREAGGTPDVAIFDIAARAPSREQSADRVRQMRLVVEAEDYEAAVRFYRDVLDLPEELAVSGPDGAHVTILSAGRATLELANPAQKRFIDDVEVGQQVAPRVRVAFEVADARAVLDDLLAAGAELIAPPVVTPWRSLNTRLGGPAGLQLTLFEELGGQD
jgi:catechol 2,3-dioxygenase-like lactoylglutathione lyase family enzyme